MALHNHKAVCSDTLNHISSHGSKRLAGTKQASSGQAANPRSVQHASPYHQTLVALAPSTCAGEVHGNSIHLNPIGSRIAATGCTQSNASVNSSSAAQPRRVCSHCGTSKCPGKTWRTGPAGPRSLCNACGLNYSRHGAGGLKSSSRPASTAAPELAAGAVAELPTAQPQLERVSSSCNNHAAAANDSQHSATVALRAIPVTADKTCDNVVAAAPAGQTRAPQQSNSSGADQIERSNLRRSLRQKRPRVPYDEVDSPEPGRKIRARKSPPAAAMTAATGSETRRSQRQKRQREPCGEAELPHAGKVARAIKPASAAAAAAAASGVVLQAEPAVPGLGALQNPPTELALSGGDVHAAAVQVLSIVAPGAPRFRVRKSKRVEERKERQSDALKAAAAAAEAQEAAETLLGLAGCCWVECLVVAARKELDTV